MKALLIITAAVMLTGCNGISREDIDAYNSRVQQAEEQVQMLAEKLPAAINAAETAAELAERMGSEHAAQAARAAAEFAANLQDEIRATERLLAELRANPPQEGEPWWVVVGGIASTLLGTYVGHRRGLYKPVPQR